MLYKRARHDAHDGEVDATDGARDRDARAFHTTGHTARRRLQLTCWSRDDGDRRDENTRFVTRETRDVTRESRDTHSCNTYNVQIVVSLSAKPVVKVKLYGLSPPHNRQ
jgi:hypothetical protein